MTEREKVKERVRNAFANAAWHHALDPCEYVAEMLADELTFAKDTHVPSKWIPVTERLPKPGRRVIAFKKGMDGSYTFLAKIVANKFAKAGTGLWKTSRHTIVR